MGPIFIDFLKVCLGLDLVFRFTLKVYILGFTFWG